MDSLWQGFEGERVTQQPWSEETAHRAAYEAGRASRQAEVDRLLKVEKAARELSRHARPIHGMDGDLWIALPRMEALRAALDPPDAAVNAQDQTHSQEVSNGE